MTDIRLSIETPKLGFETASASPPPAAGNIKSGCVTPAPVEEYVIAIPVS